MTTQRDIEIVQGQTWTELFLIDGLVSTGNGLRLHIRDHHGATLLRAALAHDNAANERISFATGGVLANLGASISTAWDLQGQPVRRWVYSIERYSLTDADDVSVLFMGTAIVRANPTDESSITKVTPFPSYDEACIRFDVEQTLSEPQKTRVRANIGVGEGGALVNWGAIGGTMADQTDLASALATKASTSHNHSGVYEPAGAITTHEAASDPHPGYLQNLASSGTSAVIVTISSDGTVLSRSSYTAAQLITAAAAAAPVQSVAGRTGTVTLAVADVAGAEASANKAQANGYASLDSGGKVPQAQIPAIAITEYLGDVASQAAMLALSGQKGDWCTRSDTGATWIITGTDPTLLGSWTSVTYPASPVTSVAGRTGAVTLSTSDVSGLGTAATLNVPASGNAASGEVVKGSDTRLDVAATIVAATAKTTPVDADVFGIADSAASNVLKKLSWANIKATAKAYFDTLYQAVLVSGTNIKTINSTSLLGSGDIAISASPGGYDGTVLYNSSGASAGDAGLMYQGGTLTATGTIKVDSGDYVEMLPGYIDGGYYGDPRWRFFLNGDAAMLYGLHANKRRLILTSYNSSVDFELLGGPLLGIQSGDFIVRPCYANQVGGYAADGRHLRLVGGASYDGAAVDRDGGHVYIDGGEASNSGADGDVRIGANRGRLLVACKSEFAAPIGMPTYTVATVPSASLYPRGIIYVSDETGGAVMAFSDATNWRRVTDRAVVS